ncbi:MAG: protein kinase [Deltaproteobacteria bacterium]|nr:protein kinase [Deltaproteobacteria bacterium]
MERLSFSVLGPLMGGFGSQAFLGCVHESGGIRPAVMVFLPDDVVEDADTFRKVVAETQLATQIDHLHVIGVHGLIRLDEGVARLVEFADAESLRAVYSRAADLGLRVPVPITLALLAGACSGVHYAHELGRSTTGQPMVHGGLRPETLLVGFHGMCKVTGYGAATIAEAYQRTRASEPSLRDSYTSTEQHFGGRQAAAVQSDVYALGAILYEALTGKKPVAADVSDAEDQHQAGLLARPVKGLTEKLGHIVIRAMRKRSTDRFGSVLEMRDALLETGARASNEEVTAFMNQLFPADWPARVARRELLAKAVGLPVPQATVPLVNSAGEESAEARLPINTSSPAIPVVPVAASPAPRAAAPAPAPAPARPALTEAELEALAAPRHPAPSEGTPWTGWLVLGLAGGAALALGAWLLQTPPPAPAPPPPAPAPAPAPAPPSPVEPAAAPSAPEPAPVAKPAPPPGPARLSIRTSPALDLVVDGKPAGHGNATVEVEPGEHVVRGTDKAQGLDVSRSVSVVAGTTRYVTFEIGKGTLVLEVEPGCDVFIDGKKRGTTPMEPLEVWEGRHHATVVKGKAKFEQPFVMKPGFEMTLQVGFRKAGE